MGRPFRTQLCVFATWLLEIVHKWCGCFCCLDKCYWYLTKETKTINCSACIMSVNHYAFSFLSGKLYRVVLCRCQKIQEGDPGVAEQNGRDAQAASNTDSDHSPVTYRFQVIHKVLSPSLLLKLRLNAHVIDNRLLLQYGAYEKCVCIRNKMFYRQDFAFPISTILSPHFIYYVRTINHRYIGVKDVLFWFHSRNCPVTSGYDIITYMIHYNCLLCYADHVSPSMCEKAKLKKKETRQSYWTTYAGRTHRLQGKQNCLVTRTFLSFGVKLKKKKKYNNLRIF